MSPQVDKSVIYSVRESSWQLEFSDDADRFHHIKCILMSSNWCNKDTWGEKKSLVIYSSIKGKETAKCLFWLELML